MTRHDDLSGINFHVVVKGLDGFHIQMVGRVVHDDRIGMCKHHAGNHAAHLSTSREAPWRFSEDHRQ